MQIHASFPVLSLHFESQQFSVHVRFFAPRQASQAREDLIGSLAKPNTLE